MKEAGWPYLVWSHHLAVPTRHWFLNLHPHVDWLRLVMTSGLTSLLIAQAVQGAMAVAQ